MSAVTLELHLSIDPALPRRYGGRIKALGGSYQPCRGYSMQRFAHVPATVEGYALADRLLREYPHRDDGSTVVVRGYRTDAGSGESVVLNRVRSTGDLRARLAREVKRKRLCSPSRWGMRSRKRAVAALCGYLARFERTPEERAAWLAEATAEMSKWVRRTRNAARAALRDGGAL